MAKVRPIYQRLNISNLEKRVSARVNKPQTFQATLFDPVAPDMVQQEKMYSNIENTAHNYKVVHNIEELKFLVESILKQKEICFDTETTSLNIFEAELVGISFSWKEKEAYYVPFPKDNETQKTYLEEFSKILLDENIRKIGQNIKFDILVFRNYGIEVKGEIFDTMLAHYLLEPEQRHNMTYLSEKYLKYTPVPIEDLIGKVSNNGLWIQCRWIKFRSMLLKMLMLHIN
ncbi:MAG: hypothetical protein HC905_20680 [Bacteroidales bacterium]|nr:hypothetical protein [Bacteroidales bacterium]